MAALLKSHVLVIDDEPAIRQTLTRLIQSAGCQVTAVGDGQAALAVLEKPAFDLVYLDIHLPGMNGLEVLRALRKHAPHLPVILLTGNATLQSALEALRLGATDYLLKPIDPEVLIARTRVILQEQALERRRRELEEQIAALQAELQALNASATPSSAAPTPLPNPTDRFVKRGPLILDLQTQRGTLADKILSIPPTAFAYLVILARHSPEVVTYETLVTEAQGYTQTTRYEAQEIAKWHIHSLRQALEPLPAEPHYILNVRGTGYRLVFS
jgi:DNA-binding response OmpR family regulator